MEGEDVIRFPTVAGCGVQPINVAKWVFKLHLPVESRRPKLPLVDLFSLLLVVGSLQFLERAGQFIVALFVWEYFEVPQRTYFGLLDLTYFLRF